MAVDHHRRTTSNSVAEESDNNKMASTRPIQQDHHHHHQPTTRITSKEVVEAQRRILKRPLLAVPTVILFILSAAAWIASLYYGGVYFQTHAAENNFGSALRFALSARNLPRFLLTVAISTVAVFCHFTVVHDGTHRSISRIGWINEALGFSAGLFFGPPGLFAHVRTPRLPRMCGILFALF
eukprot:GEZU01021836.1.p1 GENE.GEZU01021836.1~~GEZU01021836.1.p1  ORF type:complete len:182 (+),score=14.95 GEZU01021836.1:238-783(+)